MNKVFLSSVSLISSLAMNKEEHHLKMLQNISGVKIHKNKGFQNEDLSMGLIESIRDSRIEHLLTLIFDDLEKNIDQRALYNSKTRFIVSTTKADMSCFPNDTFDGILSLIENKFNAKNRVFLLSNACISGVLAVNTAADFINYLGVETCIVIGIDLLWDFINYGFQSLFAVSNEICKPFDENRNGISIGEAGACIVLSSNTFVFKEFYCEYISGSSSNDANHISGPSRTGEGLFRSISKTLIKAKISSNNINFISAHGTATVFNDEMESIAFERANLLNIPINSLKAYFGHTFGAAGVLEIGVCLLSMEKNTLYKSLGFDKLGTSRNINVLSKHTECEVDVILKTSSGFGGGNATLLLKKLER